MMLMIVSVIDMSVWLFGFLCRISYVNSVMIVGIVFVMMFVVIVFVCCMLLSISSVNMKVLKKVCRNRFSYLLCLIVCIFMGLNSGYSMVIVIMKCSVVRMVMGMNVMMDLLILMLLLMNSIDRMRKRV